MGNEQSSLLSPKEREAVEREERKAAEQRDLAVAAALNEAIDRARDAAFKKFLQEHAIPESDCNGTIGDTPSDSGEMLRDVNEASPPRRKRKAAKKARETSDVESASGEDSEYDDNPRKRKKIARPPPIYKAAVGALAEAGTIKVTGSTADIDNGIILRIKKCLERAKHPNTPESEAKAALRLASRLMKQYNVSQAEVLAHEPPSAQQQYAGQSVVMISRTDEEVSKPVRHFAYVDLLSQAMRIFFDCKSYSTQLHAGLEMTFYGIAENTVAAAYSFEMTYNLIGEWSRPHKDNGPRNSYCLGVSDELIKMAEKEKAEEEKQAKKAEAEAMASKVRQEAVERQAQLDRLAPLPEDRDERSPAALVSYVEDAEDITRGDFLGQGNIENPICLDSDSDPESSGDDDDDDDDDFDHGPGTSSPPLREDEEDSVQPDFDIKDECTIDDSGEVEEQIKKLAASNRSSSKTVLPPTTHDSDPVPKIASEQSANLAGTDQAPSQAPEPEPGEEAKWASHMQLVTFRNTATKIAEDFIKEKGLKLGRGKKRSFAVRDPDAYDQGRKDGKKIDVHRRTIKE